MGMCTTYTVNSLIQYNYVHHITLNFYDGGAIYTAASDGKILNNICTDGVVGSMSQGIYIDINSYNTEVAYNFATGFHWNLQSNINYNNNFHHNTFYSDGSTSNIQFNIEETYAINDIINNNLLVAKTPATASITVNSTLVRAETITNNKYYYPFGKVGTGSDISLNKITTSWYTLAQWVADESRVVWTRTGETEITPSLYSGSAKPQLNFLIYLTNPAKTVRTVQSADLPYSDYLDMDGVPMSYPFTIPAYGSKVLVRPN
jgi:hypothetical protein